MSEIDLYATLAKLRDFFNGAAEAIDELIQQKSKTVLREYDPSKLVWEDRTGSKGPFELCDAEKNKDSSDYKALLEHLNETKNKNVVHQGFYYWLFTDGKTIGRKPQQKKAEIENKP